DPIRHGRAKNGCTDPEHGNPCLSPQSYRQVHQAQTNGRAADRDGIQALRVDSRTPTTRPDGIRVAAQDELRVLSAHPPGAECEEDEGTHQPGIDHGAPYLAKRPRGREVLARASVPWSL